MDCDHSEERNLTTILSSRDAPHYLKQLSDQFEQEWGVIEPFEGTHPEILVPVPLVAIDGRDLLVGGLAFSSYLQPATKELAVWINAVFVALESRRMGIASNLIQHAVIEAARIHIKELFVYTHIPSLYQNLGWNIVERGNTHSVLAYGLALEIEEMVPEV